MTSEILLNRLAARTRESFEVRQLNNMLGPTEGTVWRTKPAPQSSKAVGPTVLVLTSRENLLSVVSVSKDISYALDGDLILERNESGLPFRCMVRTDDRFPTTKEDLLSCVGELADSWMQLIHALCNRLTRSIEQVVNDGPMVKILDPYELMTRVYYGSVGFGLPCVGEDDPRLYLLRKSVHERRYLSRRAKFNFRW